MDLLAGLAPLPELAPQPAIAQPLAEDPTAPDNEKEPMESGVAWPQAEEAPARDVRGAAVLVSTSVNAFELLPDETSSEEPQPASRDGGRPKATGRRLRCAPQPPSLRGRGWTRQP